MKRFQLIPSVLLILILSACSSSQTTPVSKLIGPTWTLTSLLGEAPDLEQFSAGLPTLNFLEGQGLAGFAGCNNFSGEYILTGSDINLKPGAMTRKACEGNGEDEFLTAFGKIKNFKFEKEKLTLMEGTTELMSFSPTKN